MQHELTFRNPFRTDWLARFWLKHFNFTTSPKTYINMVYLCAAALQWARLNKLKLFFFFFLLVGPADDDDERCERGDALSETDAFWLTENLFKPRSTHFHSIGFWAAGGAHIESSDIWTAVWAAEPHRGPNECECFKYSYSCFYSWSMMTCALLFYVLYF